MDSRVPGTTSPEGRSWSPGYFIGPTTIKTTSTIDVTQCNMYPMSEIWERTAKVVACLPEWSKDALDNIKRLANDGTPIKIQSPVGEGQPLYVAIETATKAWNDALESAGENRIFDETPAPSCTIQQGGHCVKMLVQSPPEDPTLCGQANGPVDANGIFTAFPTIWIKPQYSTDPDYLAFLIGHELSHLLGVKNALGCTSPNSIRNDVDVCNSLVTTEGNLPTVPQPSDVLPVVDTVYGPGSREVCG